MSLFCFTFILYGFSAGERNDTKLQNAGHMLAMLFSPHVRTHIHINGDGNSLAETIMIIIILDGDNNFQIVQTAQTIINF